MVLLILANHVANGMQRVGRSIDGPILWEITGSLRRATRWATMVGQGIAWLFIIAGIAMAFGVQIPILGTGFISGLWLAFIGWFLNNAASQSYRQVVIEDVLEGIPVSRIMRADPSGVSPDISVSQLVDDSVALIAFLQFLHYVT